MTAHAHTLAGVRLGRLFARLDVKMPGWENRVVLPKLDFADPYNCLLAQLYGDYETGCTALFREERGAERDAIDHGVCCSLRDNFASLHVEDSIAEYAILTRVAKQEIKKRLLQRYPARLVNDGGFIANMRYIFHRLMKRLRPATA